MKRRIGLAWPVLVVLLAACGGTPPGPPKDVVALPPASPLDVSVTLDTVRAVTQTIPQAGGSLSATSEDGTVYTLSVPASALAADTAITMTPLVALEGAPVTGGRLHGVELEPDGLRLYDFATLTIEPAGEVAEAVGFASQGGGRDFYLHPLALEPGLSMKLMHFSDYGVFTRSETEPILIVEEPGTFMPFDWESQLRHMMEELIRQEREAQLAGREGDPDFHEKMVAILNTFFIQVIEPLLGRIATDCDFAKANVAKVLSWSRQIALLSLDATFAAETAAVTQAVVKGMDNCWQEAIQPCVNRSDAEQFAEVVSIARVNILLGGSEEKYDPLDTDIQCDCADVAAVTAWQGSIQYSQSRDVSNGSSHVIYDLEVDVGARLEERGRNASAVSFFGGVPDGIISLSSEDHSHGEDYHRVDVTFSGSGTPVPWDAQTVSGSHLSLSILLQDCSYSFYFRGAVAGSGTFFDEPYESQEGINPIKGEFGGASLSISGSADFPVYDPDDIEASVDKPVWYAERYDVADILGAGNLGTVRVSWTFTPVETP